MVTKPTVAFGMIAAALGCLMAPLPASAVTLLADFDSFQEGNVGTQLEDGGIVFSDLDIRIEGFPPPSIFTIDNAGTDLGAGHSPPNVLGFNGFSEGPGVGFARLGSASISFGSMLAGGASMDVFGSDGSLNQLTLTALLGGVTVGQDTISLAGTPGEPFIWHQVLEVSGVAFDSLRLVASGPQDDGAAFVVLDNVQVALVPEPSSIALFSAGLLGLIYWRRRPVRES